ncbi:MAG TPA: VWA domain-containing protein, partial [Thermoanaerobaculia bacterium]|nr:VWA domain-containing protein [Thermoanaerobaculia bacterium]
MSRKLAPFLIIAMALAGAAHSQTSQDKFSDTTDVVVVEVPVQVLRDGEPVRGLTAEDFEVFEGRRKLPLTGFEVLDLDQAETPPPGADQKWKPATPTAARRHFLLLFDLAFSSPKAIGQAQKAGRDLVAGLHPVDLVAVGSYSPSKGPQLLLGFTGDKTQIGNALDMLGKPEMFDRIPDPLRLVLGGGSMSSGGEGGGSGSGRSAEGSTNRKEMLAEAFIDAAGTYNSQLAAESARLERTSQQRAIAAMTRAFADLAKTMGGLYGRKYVVLFSEGFDSSVYQGSANVDDQLVMSAESARGHIWGVDSEQRYGSTKTTTDLEKMLEEFRRADCVVQSVDIGGLKERGGAEAQWVGGRDSLFFIADSTGGELYENFNDLSAAMGQMLKRTSVTYLLAFQPEGLKRDGTYHRLRVELKNAAKGTRVIHRPGFYAPRPFGEQGAAERMLQTARQVISGEENGAIPASVLAAPFPTGTEQAYVPVLVEVDGPALLAGHPAGKPLPAE